MLTALLTWYTALAGLWPLGSPRLPCQSSQGVDLTGWLQVFEHSWHIHVRASCRPTAVFVKSDSMLIQGIFEELVLVDIDRVKLEGEVMDLVHGLSFVEPASVKAGTVADCQGADMVIITAGAKQRTGESRMDLLGRNVTIFRSLISELVQYCPDAIYLVVSNPVDG